MKRLFLIDGTALAYRAHFAFSTSPRGGLTTADGRPTSAVYGVLTTLISLFEAEQPDAVVIAFDGARQDLQRTKVFAEYKSTRDKMPDELVGQLSLIERAVTAYGLPIVRSTEHEADDVIGTLAVAGREAGMAVFIVTSDKDFMQIVGPRIRLWNLRASTRAPDVIGPAEVEAKFGVKPEQMVDLLALMGDSSDNIPGVPKVGAKTAAQLLVDYGDLDTVLERAEEVSRPALRASLLQHREQALLSRDLVRLRTDLQLGIRPEELQPPSPDRATLEDLFRELEFESLLKSLPTQSDTAQLPTDYSVVTTPAATAALVAELSAAERFSCHAEMAGSAVLGLAFSPTPGRAAYVPLPARGSADQSLDADLRDLLRAGGDRIVAHDSKTLRRTLSRLELDPGPLAADVQLASYCLAANQSSHDLQALTLRHFGYKRAQDEPAKGKKKKQKTFADIDPHVVGELAAADADYVLRLHELLEPRLAEESVDGVLRDIELPLVDVLLSMESEGIAIDSEHLQRLSKELEERCQKLEERVFDLVGEPFNLNSPAQVGQAFFDRLELHKVAGIARPKRTRTGQYKTDAATLETLARAHEAPRLLLEHRQLTKLKGTYVDSLPALVSEHTGRVHTTFNQAVAATGRLSSDHPNLQNIPIRTEEGRKVRRAFVARARDWVLLSADYSQIELRILAHMSGDETLIESFRNHEDIHARTAALVHGLAPDEVTSELRTQAKAINYGLMYGMGASRLARETGMSPPEAKRFIKAYFVALPGVKALLDRTLEHARAEREVRTLFGRRRPLPEIESANAMQRVAAENMAVNTPIQGTAADIIKRAMLDTEARLRDAGHEARLLLQVHDELVLDVPRGELDAVQALVRTAMEGAADLAVPLEVTMGSGDNWLEAH